MNAKESSTLLPLLAPMHAARPIAWRNGEPVRLAAFMRDVCAIAAAIEDRCKRSRGDSMINLCEDRYRFLAAYAAALQVGHEVLLPPARAEQIVAEISQAHPGSYRCDDTFVECALREAGRADPGRAAWIPGRHVAMVGVTSGSTGQPKSYPKHWSSLHASTAHNVASIRAALAWPASSPATGATAHEGWRSRSADSAAAEPGDGAATTDRAREDRLSTHDPGRAPTAQEGQASASAWILATVPPQHMYGMELSVLLPLIGGMAVHSGRPLFPADIARALGELPQPRILVSTPVHLRSLVESGVSFPPTPLIASATAPLDRTLAREVEHRFGGRLLELFGSTETCVIATRRTAIQEEWRTHPGVRLEPREDGTLVDAPWFAAPVLLQDRIEMRAPGRFVVRGRNADMVEVAGKRASLGDLTRRLLAIEGVRDAVVLQPDRESVATVRRLAALVVAPGLQPHALLEQLARSVDPAFLPRPLLLVDALPRDELGKLPREQLLQLLRR